MTKGSCEWHDRLLRKLDDSKEGAHRVQILIVVEKLTEVLEELAEDVLWHVGFVEDCLAGLVQRLPHEELLDAGRSV